MVSRVPHVYIHLTPQHCTHFLFYQFIYMLHDRS